MTHLGSGLVLDTITLLNIKKNSGPDINVEITYSFDPAVMAEKINMNFVGENKPGLLSFARTELVSEIAPTAFYSVQNWPVVIQDIEQQARTILNERLALKGSGINVLLVKIGPAPLSSNHTSSEN